MRCDAPNSMVLGGVAGMWARKGSGFRGGVVLRCSLGGYAMGEGRREKGGGFRVQR
jgi:hypothetical protein